MPGTPDFSKIWAQNSPLDPYVITDGNYLEGLNFIGSQPPDRGIFDAWMNNADQKMKYLYDNSASSESLTEHNDNPSAHSKLTLTMNDLLTPTKDTDTLVNLLSGLGRRFRDVTGKGNWYDAPDISLATLATLVSNLASGSDVQWSGSKFTNAKLGISGLMAQNGYIQFGPNFGGLIVQWGTGSCNTVRTLPLALSTFKVAFAMHQGTVTNTVIISSQDYASSLTQVKFLTNNSNDTAFVMYIIIGR
ncbi:hypothetical protein [Megasphaera stantonii]|uniref:Uncharacterized protein n=2 Tax=Megasphaera stantonii TaxID=2144175 RepID=A0A346B183_9FIRM|nr:hypothetical protein [Megasphaera stantonii]AXL21876.1 hypothetical protein DKB62_10040 [Megasphaera stantonii]